MISKVVGKVIVISCPLERVVCSFADNWGEYTPRSDSSSVAPATIVEIGSPVGVTESRKLRLRNARNLSVKLETFFGGCVDYAQLRRKDFEELLRRKLKNGLWVRPVWVAGGRMKGAD